MTPFHENLRGILAIVACNFLFLINDTMIKLASAELPLGEIITIRGAFATMVLVPVVVAAGLAREIRLIRQPALIWRTLAEIGAAYFYLIALFHIPISNTNTIIQVVPLAVTACAAIFLGHAVGWKRWIAIVIGFLGVVVVIRPGLEGFNAYGLLALVSAGFITIRDMATRVMPAGVPTLLIALTTAVVVGLTGPIFGVVAGEQWIVPSGHALLLLATAVIFLVGGYLLSVDFMRHGDIAVVAPFRYTVILWAMIVGFVVWGETPDLPMLVGSAIIIATGVYTFHRERRLSARAAIAAIGE
jgi:drug/metabolite transporter (DMT)-like permease